MFLLKEELLDMAVLPYMSQIAEDQDVTVRTRAVQLLVDLAQTCESTKYADILKILEKVNLSLVQTCPKYCISKVMPQLLQSLEVEASCQIV